MSLLDTTQIALQDAMQGSMLRQTLLTNNLANVDTPGYKRQDVDFQGTLRAALESGQPLDQVTFKPFTDPQVMRADGNGVSVDQEAAYASENGLLHQELTQIAAAREQILQSAMGVR
ncbi:MAG TPA: flagellar basal body protein [Solirubrobacteraceae bacterium]|nr:flagellar basal body protein [Solirubrobacteraceae bacterium]